MEGRTLKGVFAGSARHLITAVFRPLWGALRSNTPFKVKCRASERMRDALSSVINMVAVVTVLYALAYFGLAKRGATIEFAGYWASWPDYHGVPEAIFEPLQYLDATRLRPWFWTG